MATNDFLPFGTGVGANVLDQASYAALAARTGGFSSGVAKSNEVNKAIRQSSAMSAMIGQFIADKAVANASDDGDLATLQARFIAALAATYGPNVVHFAAGGGTANAMTGTFVPTFSALADGMIFEITPAATNTDAATLNAQGLGAKAIVRRDGSAISPGDIVIGQKTLLAYHAATDHFQLLTPTVRTRLSSTTTFYVATTGNDTTGDGSSGAPWATIQGAVDKITNLYEFNGTTVTISVANGTYTGSVVIAFQISGGSLILSGNTTTPASCIISTTGDCISLVATNIKVQGFKFVSASGSALRAYRGGQIEISGKVDFGACALAHMYAINSGSRIIISSNYNITGGAQNHMLAWYGLGEISSNAPFAVTLTGTPNFSGAFVWAANGCVVRVPNITFSGSATGVRYGGGSGGVIDTSGGGANYFPGNSAGGISTGYYL